MTTIFAVFFLAYGLIAPLSVFAGVDVFLRGPFRTGFFLANYCLACGGLVLAIAVAGLTGRDTAPPSPTTQLNAGAMLFAATLFAAAATIFETINVVRAGGLELILSGKLAYQSAVTALTGTLPTEFAARAAIAMTGLAASHFRIENRPLPTGRMVAFAIIILPVVAGYIYLGRRTEILALLMILVVAATWTIPVRRLSLKLILSVIAVYLGFVIFFILRETLFNPAEGYRTADHFLTATLHALLPAKGEFGAPFGVFSEYLKRADDSAMLWGASYLDGFALIVPSFLYPGDKPVQLDVALFALANPTRTAITGDISGYGYSPILEAYVNFGSIGVALAFFLFGLGLAFMERARARTGRFAVILLYLMVLPMAQQFHRSTFGNAVLSPCLWIAITILFASAFYCLAAWRLAPKSAGRK